MPNGRVPDSPHYAYKLAWHAALRDGLVPEVAAGGRFALCGDFNVAPTDADVWDRPCSSARPTSPRWSGRRSRPCARWGLDDGVPTPMKGPHPFTYWDYRAGMFHQNQGMRIDLVYATPAFASRVSHAYVDREARKGKAPSDHAPIVVDAAD